MRVMLITNYWHFLEEKGSSRYYTLAKLLAANGIEVEVVTSRFYHRTKTHRRGDRRVQDGFLVTMLPEMGYKRNISTQRILSYCSFARALSAYLRSVTDPDLIYIVIPPTAVATAAMKHAIRKNIPRVVDIQDLWPEAFYMLLPSKRLLRTVFSRWRNRAERVYGNADAVVAVSASYLRRGLGARSDRPGLSVFLGTELREFDRHAIPFGDNGQATSALQVGYVGSLGASYDLETVIEALRRLRITGVSDFELVVMGDGPKRGTLERTARAAGIAHTFTGMLPYADMVRRLSRCDIAVNPIRRGTAASIINKHADYFAAGLPIVNTQESLELQQLLETRNAGINCHAGDAGDVAAALMTLRSDPALRHDMARQSRRIAEELFDRSRTYLHIVDLIESLVASSKRVSGIAHRPQSSERATPLAESDSAGGNVLGATPGDVS